MNRSDSSDLTTTAAMAEARLDQIKRAAAEGTLIAGREGKPPGHPQISSNGSYYGLPLLKPPVWTWEIPLYFFIGGISGVSAAMGLAAQFFQSDPDLVGALLWMGLIGAAICPLLLIADLGRPGRFLNMLRVLKPQSPMSLGAWILVLFSGCEFVSVAGHELMAGGFGSPLVIVIQWIGATLGAVTGLLLASYTAVLIGATANPLWSKNRELLPVHFLASGLGSSAGILELLGFLVPATQTLGFVAAGIETALEIVYGLRKPPVNAPLNEGKTGLAFHVAGLLAGPTALLIRLLWSAPAGRWTSAICFLAGALLSRYAWMWAGRASAANPEAALRQPR